MPDAKEKRLELILQQLEQLPTLPAVAIRVMETTANDQSSAREVVELIASDPALTSRILQLVHRADQGVSGQVQTVDRAVVLLGFEAVRCAVLAVSVFQTVNGRWERSSTRFSREEFWKHSVAVACCAELLAEAIEARDARAGGSDAVTGAEAFVCGLLHDMGKVALDTVLPKSFDRIIEAAELVRGNIADLERSVIGLDHMVAGKRLAEQWRLPDMTRDCIWLHGQHPDALPPSVKNRRMVNLVTLADALVREQHLGYSGNYTLPSFKAALIKAAGLDEQAVAFAQQHLVAKIEQRAQALGLSRSSSGELYLSALAQANHELGRMGEQLAAKNRRLATRARFFETLAQFQGELRPDAAPMMVLRAIGQTAVSSLGMAPVAVFSVQPGEAYAEVVVVDEMGNPIATSVQECPTRLTEPYGGEGPVLRVTDDLEWLVSGVAPHLSGQQHYWMCLETDGVCIGGVLWGARPGEGQRLAGQAQELQGLCAGWSLALRTAQIREQSIAVAEQLADTNRQLQSAQAELLRSRTMASLGELAAGAAHEMNNPLAVISGRSQLLASQLSDAKLKHAASTIAEQAHRLSQIITDMMDFAKPMPPHVQEVDLAELLMRAVSEIKERGDVGARRIELTMSEVPHVAVDPQQIQAALTQILHNAVQATDERNGQIAIHAAYDTCSSCVAVNVIDNGRGMDQETLRRAFDPFFSSLPAGRRRGMGLAKALRWVESSGGAVRLESHINQGTRVTVILPAAQPVADHKPLSSKKVAEG